jgi:hypothetical protein
VRTSARIATAQAAHNERSKAILADREKLRKLAKDLKWTEDRVRGFMAGVGWAYGWVLGDGED